MITYPIVGMKYISKNSASMDWDFIVSVLSCVWTSDHRSVVIYEWEESPGFFTVGMNGVEFFNSEFERYREI